MDYRVIYSARRTLALEIKKNREIVVRAPNGATEAEIRAFVSAHTEWLEKHLRRMEERSLPPLSETEERDLRARARADLPGRTAMWAARMGISYSGVKITSARSRFGSCNSRGGIAYSFRLMQFPERVIDYVVVHELAHRKEMNHSSRFYAIVAAYLPDYKERIKLFKHCPRAL